MSEFISANLPYLLAGISVGGQYALIAIGYTMVYGIQRVPSEHDKFIPPVLKAVGENWPVDI